MTIESVRDFFAKRNLDVPIIEVQTSTATVALAAEAFGVEPGRIAKTLAFGLTTEMPIYLDLSLKKYEEVLPAAGSVNSAVKVSVECLANLIGAKWTEVC